MQSLSNIIRFDFLPNNKKIAEKAKEVQVMRIWPEVFSRFCPEHVEQTMPVSFKGGVLTIAAIGSGAVDALRFCSERIAAELNREIGNTVIWHIRCES